jgi:hypothetical protein
MQVCIILRVMCEQRRRGDRRWRFRPNDAADHARRDNRVKQTTDMPARRYSHCREWGDECGSSSMPTLGAIAQRQPGPGRRTSTISPRRSATSDWLSCMTVWRGMLRSGFAMPAGKLQSADIRPPRVLRYMAMRLSRAHPHLSTLETEARWLGI